jgi:hypothetical protein
LTHHDADDRLGQYLDRLPPLTPDSGRAARVRARCHAQLARGRRRAERSAHAVGIGRRVLAPVVVLGLCALYLASLVGTALRLRGVF